MNQIRIELPLPAACLQPNRRTHWGTRSRATKKARGDACLAAFNLMYRGDKLPFPWESATIQAHFTFNVRRQRDDDNLNGWMKAYRDGTADAGIVANDSAYTMLPPVVTVDKAKPEGVVLVITKGGA